MGADIPRLRRGFNFAREKRCAFFYFFPRLRHHHFFRGFGLAKTCVFQGQGGHFTPLRPARMACGLSLFFFPLFVSNNWHFSPFPYFSGLFPR
jgi:hypothetical protein